MNKNQLFTVMAALACTLPCTQADIVNTPPTVPGGAKIIGNCDLLASNTVRATFRGIRTVTSPSLNEQEQGKTTQVAVFEVIEPLAYRRHTRYGDNRMRQGQLFGVEMNRELPGQPAAVIDTIAQMQPGEEAAMKIDHLFVFGDEENSTIHPCTRIARRNAQPQATAAPQTAPADAPLPTTVTPLNPATPGSAHMTATSRETRISIVPDGQGGMKQERIDIQRDLIPGTNNMKTRMFINGTEVDPTTRQPLTAPVATTPQQSAASVQPAQPSQPPAAAPTPQPVPAAQATSSPAPGDSDDTIVEHAPTNATPAPAPAVQQPAVSAQSSQNTAPIAEEEGF